MTALVIPPAAILADIAAASRKAARAEALAYYGRPLSTGTNPSRPQGFRRSVNRSADPDRTHDATVAA